MLAVVAATLMCTSDGASRRVQLVSEDEDPFLDEEVGDQLDEEGGQDQLQVLLQPAELRLLRLDPDLLLPGWSVLLILFKRKKLKSPGLQGRKRRHQPGG